MFLSNGVLEAQSLIAKIKLRAVARCETCRFWDGRPGLLSPKGYRRCTIKGKDKSPMDWCDSYEPKV
jgi:hypothetical protein